MYGLAPDFYWVPLLMVLMKFYPSLTTAANIYSQHLKRQLILDVDLKFSTNVWLFNQNLGNVNTSYTVKDINVDAVSNREYCKCNDY